MKCPECDHEIFMDGERVETDGYMRMYYVCMNPKCKRYRKAFPLTADITVEAKMQPKGNTQ